MSLKAKLSKRKLNSSLLRNKSFDGKGGTWSDHDKSLSMPNIADTSPSKPAYPESSQNGFIPSGLNSNRNNAGKAKAFILRKLRFRSLTVTESRNFTKSDSSTSKENAYDKCPGSNSPNKKDGVDTDTALEGSSSQHCAPPNATQSHKFSQSSIGYLNAPKRGDKSKSVENVSSCSDNDTLGSNLHDEGNYVAEPGISSDSTACYECAVALTNQSDVSLGQVSGNSNNRDQTLTEQFPENRPPARPPKPIELRGEPLSKPLEEDGNVPPKPPARLPTSGISRTFPSIRAVKLLHGNRESGAYESIDEKDHSCLVAEQNLPGELRKLPQQPWYWGPLTQEQAEGKLRGLPNGYFLVRDSSDERYLLSLSFNSNGRPVHTRFEYVGGLFSINDSQGYVSVVDLIEDAVRESQNGIYSFMQNINGTQTFPARLTNPVSRFTEMKSLQHLCRFVIRETFPRHYIADLPVPEKIRKYILENQY